MDNICRLCCSTKFVNNYIFDDENALFIKMSLYLPIKVFKNDQLPQRICDRCSCKVNDFYQFCNETIEVQNRLKGLFLASKVAINQSIDLTVIKPNVQSPAPSPAFHEKSTQTTSNTEKLIKDEPAPLSPDRIKKENDYDTDDFVSQTVHSDNSEDEFLINIKKKKSGKAQNDRNGDVPDNKRGKKKKEKRVNWDLGTHFTSDDAFENAYSDVDLDVVKEEAMDLKSSDLTNLLNTISVKCKREKTSQYCCCMCFEECSTRTELLQHYKYVYVWDNHTRDCPTPKTHARAAPGAELAPPPALGEPPRCLRCQKVVPAGEWAEHWRRHYARDVRPYRCAACHRAFRDHHQILKHGLTHAAGELRAPAPAPRPAPGEPAQERFACDVCPEGFVYMRCLLSHRTRAHPEAAARALRLRCAVCSRPFAHANSLRRHLRAHSGERNFLCNVCGKALSSREHLKYHIRIHTGYKPHACRTCGKSFVKKCNLTLHERVHSGEKPHVCSHCGKAFSQRSTLVIHERYHSGARPYSCGVCGRGFVAKGLLSMHLKSACVSLPPAAPAPGPGPAGPAPARCPRLTSR